MTTEEVVRRLAAEGPLYSPVTGYDSDATDSCAACGVAMGICRQGTHGPCTVARDAIPQDRPGQQWPHWWDSPCGRVLASHAPDCLWRLAVEWVAANPKRCRVPLTNSFDPQYRECGKPLPCAVHPGSAAL